MLSTGGKGISSGSQLATAFSADGSATVAWAKPGPRYEEGGALEVFTRAADGAFGAAQTVAQQAQGIVLAAGPAGSAALAWMQETQHPKSVSYAIHASTRPQAGGPFGAEETISDTLAATASGRRSRSTARATRSPPGSPTPTAAAAAAPAAAIHPAD